MKDKENDNTESSAVEPQMTREDCLEITLNTLRDQMIDSGRYTLWVAIIDNALKAK